MNVLETLLSAGGGSIMKQLGNQFGISTDQATTATSMILPMLAGGLKEQLSSGDPGGIAKMITGGGFSRYMDSPSSLATPGALDMGKSLLGMLMGPGDQAKLASTVAEKAGIGSNIATSLLPIAATFMGGFLAKNVSSGGNLADVVGELASAGSGGILGALKSMAAKITG